MLSDDGVIARLNADFVPVTVNITDDGWPADAPALAPWHWGYDAWPFSSLGFVNALVCDPAGRLPLAWAGSGMKSEFETSPNYHPAPFLRFLDRGIANSQYAAAVRASSFDRAQRHKLLVGMLAQEFGTDDGKVEWFIRNKMGESAVE
ncbi:MAG: hypothetical protein K8T20_14380 [Planctomycetes bacterium]|nr:hypothetical protein [Planctomycetota bacterium]